jgi:hypothetical protein
MRMEGLGGLYTMKSNAKTSTEINLTEAGSPGRAAKVMTDLIRALLGNIEEASVQGVITRIIVVIVEMTAETVFIISTFAEVVKDVCIRAETIRTETIRTVVPTTFTDRLSMTIVILITTKVIPVVAVVLADSSVRSTL